MEKTKKLILNNTKNLSGIYLIFKNITGHYYVGSASTNKFYARFGNHLLYFRGSKVLKNAVKKYKLCNFSFVILKLYPEIVNKENNKLLLDIEDFYLKYLLPDYNILTEAGSSFGYKHTEITRLKMKANYSMERRILIDNLNKNKQLSKETIEKIKYKSLKRVFTEKEFLSKKKNSKSIVVYNLDKTVYGHFSSITEASKNMNCADKTITRYLKTEKKILNKKFRVNYC